MAGFRFQVWSLSTRVQVRDPQSCTATLATGSQWSPVNGVAVVVAAVAFVVVLAALVVLIAAERFGHEPFAPLLLSFGS